MKTCFLWYACSSSYRKQKSWEDVHAASLVMGLKHRRLMRHQVKIHCSYSLAQTTTSTVIRKTQGFIMLDSRRREQRYLYHFCTSSTLITPLALVASPKLLWLRENLGKHWAKVPMQPQILNWSLRAKNDQRTKCSTV